MLCKQSFDLGTPLQQGMRNSGSETLTIANFAQHSCQIAACGFFRGLEKLPFAVEESCAFACHMCLHNEIEATRRTLVSRRTKPLTSAFTMHPQETVLTLQRDQAVEI